ncbi:hypothetical protein M947_11275 [Sulfurimonas hongkongensis]|uniref:Uncharacterized protein n=1 Tax=Sulfurimonas hongkongensis TaxID=1172190 RepID=T0KLT6_9BACT|nr:hypothetical protein [Sulfurimonas hongkongensis]EQB34343.1 hypothetical protein M947_11275 [Sulfurimonas hongkongensis]
MKREIVANTFTPTYDELEDRLRFVINYQDIQNRVDFMITRSFIINLISTAEEFIAKHYSTADFKKTLIQHNIKKQESQEKLEHTKSQQSQEDRVLLKTDSANLELLRTDEELLLEVKFFFDINSKHTTLTFNSKNITAKADLDGFMLMQVFQVMKSAIPFIKWGISYNF